MAYYRVSTEKQGRSGLGIEAQREAVQRFAEELRVRGLRDGDEQPYRYEREVEEFLHYSPSVRRRTEREADPSGS